MMPPSEPPAERVVPPSRRPDGTMRKPVRIRAGYVAQEEVAIYQPKGAQLRNSAPLVPPGYDPEDANKPKTKAAKRNEKRKEKRKQARVNAPETEPAEAANDEDTVEAVAEKIESLNIHPEGKMPLPGNDGDEMPAGGKSEVEKRIRALKKKIRLATESSTASQEDKNAKLEAWRRELKELEETER